MSRTNPLGLDNIFTWMSSRIPILTTLQTDVSEEHIASIISVTGIGMLGTVSAVNIN
jgi:hypothetical protein